MEFEFIGVGSGLETKLGNTCALLGGNTMIDFGRTAPEGLGDRIKAVQNVILTHLHSDHSGGLEFLGFYKKFVQQEAKPTLYLGDKSTKKSLGKVICPKTTGFELEDMFDVKVGKEIEVKGLQVYFMRTLHSEDMHCYSLQLGSSALYSGDSKLVPLNCSLKNIFQDCALTSNPVHVCLDDLKKLPGELKARITLMHYDSELKDVDVQALGFKGLAEVGVKYEV